MNIEFISPILFVVVSIITFLMPFAFWGGIITLIVFLSRRNVKKKIGNEALPIDVIMQNSEKYMTNSLAIEIAQSIAENMARSIDYNARQHREEKFLTETYNVGGILSLNTLKCYNIGEVRLGNENGHSVYEYNYRYTTKNLESNGFKALDGVEQTTSLLCAVARLVKEFLYQSMENKSPECVIIIDRKTYTGKSYRCIDSSGSYNRERCYVIFFEIKYESKNYLYFDKNSLKGW